MSPSSVDVEGVPAPPEYRLRSIGVVVDGVGATAAAIGDALRRVGVGTLATGAYAAEPAHWDLSGSERLTTTDPPHPANLRPGLVVFVGQGDLLASVAAPWWHAGVTHLPVRARGHGILIGPLVVPGVSSCVRCHELARAASGVAGTLAGEPDRATVQLAAAVAALTVRRSLLGDHDLAGVSSEIADTRPEVTHRHWPRRPDCPCRAPSAGWANGAAHVAPWTMDA